VLAVVLLRRKPKPSVVDQPVAQPVTQPAAQPAAPPADPWSEGTPGQ
jgi:hypothetical protein